MVESWGWLIFLGAANVTSLNPKSGYSLIYFDERENNTNTLYSIFLPVF